MGVRAVKRVIFTVQYKLNIHSRKGMDTERDPRFSSHSPPVKAVKDSVKNIRTGEKSLQDIEKNNDNH